MTWTQQKLAKNVSEEILLLRYEADIAQLKKQLEESSTDIDKIRKDFKQKEAENISLTDENLSSKKKIDELNQMLENSKLEQKSLQVIRLKKRYKWSVLTIYSDSKWFWKH